MIRFKLPELILEAERRAGRRISLREIAEATGMSRQALANLASRERAVVTNTAHVEAICRFFRCGVANLIEFDPPIENTETCNIDALYPGRRRTGDDR